LRESKGLTQTELADQLGVSSKTISKWETAKGLPDITLLEPLSQALDVSIMELMSGQPIINKNTSANMLRSKLYVCPVCGNIIHCTGASVISCCGILLPPLESEEVDEELIHCVIGVSGSSPAYTYMYIDALAQAAEANGMEAEKAKVFAAQAVLGAAKMVLENMDTTPEQLRINVCSPGGTTIEAVNTLFENGFMEDVKDGFQAAVDKSRKMTK
jgi:DNA-binding XRE family transcriptional regulator